MSTNTRNTRTKKSSQVVDAYTVGVDGPTLYVSTSPTSSSLEKEFISRLKDVFVQEIGKSISKSAKPTQT